MIAKKSHNLVASFVLVTRNFVTCNNTCSMLKIVSKIFSFFLSLPVLFYRYSISPFLTPSCRYVPTCSQYMLDALKIHGPFWGLIMGIKRILRCRPGGGEGYDPVPLVRKNRKKG